jgi:hypothetical protein
MATEIATMKAEKVYTSLLLFSEGILKNKKPANLLS